MHSNVQGDLQHHLKLGTGAARSAARSAANFMLTTEVVLSSCTAWMANRPHVMLTLNGCPQIRAITEEQVQCGQD
jgi:hypothetical protein